MPAVHTYLDPEDTNPFGKSPEGFRDTVPAVESKSLEDKLFLGIINGQITATMLADRLISELSTGIEKYCAVPERYSGCSLSGVKLADDIAALGPQLLDEVEILAEGRIVNPSAKQLKTMAFFRGILREDFFCCDSSAAIPSLVPSSGMYIKGMPGCGKTHMMAAAALLFKKKLEHVFGEFRDELIVDLKVQFKDLLKAERDTISGFNVTFDMDAIAENLDADLMARAKKDDKFEVIKTTLSTVREKITKSGARPTAILFVEFDKFAEDYIRADPEQAKALLDRICEADLLFIDDMHPKGDAAKAQLIQHFFERRYHSGKFGTFITSNLEVDAVTGTRDKNDEDMVNARIQSRLGSSYVEIDIDDAKDWRSEVHKKRIEQLDLYIVEQMVPILEREMEETRISRADLEEKFPFSVIEESDYKGLEEH